MPATRARPSEDGRSEDGRSELRRRRDALAEQVAELHWDLGGLTYEMAIRDHFRLDVLVRRAAILQERDAELAELERLLALEQSASVGVCSNCGAPHSRGAAFCWQCGTALMERIHSSAVPAAADGAGQESTAVMQALLAPEAGRSRPEG
jgi:ribosomal protein L40E